MDTLRNSFDRRNADMKSSKLKRIHDAPLCTIYESKGDINQPIQDDSPLLHQPKIREKSLILSIPTRIKDPIKLSPISSMMIRTSSLSPARQSQVEEAILKKKLHLPMPGTQAGLLYSDYLTQQEIREITSYQEVFFLGEKIYKSESGFTDEEGRYKGKIGGQLAFRYEIIEKLGKGTFGNVYKCYDHKRDISVAIKIMRNNSTIRQQAGIEIENLDKLFESDLDDSKCIVKMRQSFEFRGHICICFELLS